VDGQRFDNLAKALAERLTRREAGRLALGTVGLTLSGGHLTVAEKKKKKNRGGQRRPKNLDDLMSAIDEVIDVQSFICGGGLLNCTASSRPSPKSVAKKFKTIRNLAELSRLLLDQSDALSKLQDAMATHGHRSVQTCQALKRVIEINRQTHETALALFPPLQALWPLPPLPSRSCGNQSCCDSGELCINGTCGCSKAVGQSCSRNPECCGNDTQSSVCGNTQCATSVCCRRDFQSCSKDCDCCTVAGVRMSCQGGLCKPVPTCKALLEPCSNSSECCGFGACDYQDLSQCNLNPNQKRCLSPIGGPCPRNTNLPGYCYCNDERDCYYDGSDDVGVCDSDA
jgi:hypothetical protein